MLENGFVLWAPYQSFLAHPEQYLSLGICQIGTATTFPNLRVTLHTQSPYRAPGSQLTSAYRTAQSTPAGACPLARDTMLWCLSEGVGFMEDGHGHSTLSTVTLKSPLFLQYWDKFRIIPFAGGVMQLCQHTLPCLFQWRQVCFMCIKCAAFWWDTFVVQI